MKRTPMTDTEIVYCAASGGYLVIVGGEYVAFSRTLTEANRTAKQKSKALAAADASAK